MRVYVSYWRSMLQSSYDYLCFNMCVRTPLVCLLSGRGRDSIGVWIEFAEDCTVFDVLLGLVLCELKFVDVVCLTRMIYETYCFDSPTRKGQISCGFLCCLPSCNYLS